MSGQGWGPSLGSTGSGAPRAWTLDTIPWATHGDDGTMYALLEESRRAAGAPFTYAFFLPSGFWDPPHWHTQDARVVVVRGTLRLQYGDTLDPAAAAVYPEGSVLLVPAHAAHYDGAREDTLIIGVSQGIWRTHYVDPRHEGSAGTGGR